MAQNYPVPITGQEPTPFYAVDDPVSYTNSNGITVPAPTVWSTHTLDLDF